MAKEKNKMELGDFANLLHSAVFSLEKSLQDVMGNQHIILTSRSTRYISGIERKKGSKLFSGGSLESAIKNFIEFTSESDFVDRLDIKKVDGEKYIVEIEGCSLAKTGVHEALNPEMDICPLALAAGAVFKYVEPDRDVIADPSRFTDEGSETVINFIKIV